LICRFGGRIIAALCVLTAATVLAADPNQTWRVRPWQSDDGLPDNSVAGLAQTPEGYIWVGTPSGLARFDGIQFETFSLTNVIAPPNRGIITMISGRDDSLWLAMDRGAVVYLSGKASRSYALGLPDFIPNSMADAADGTLLITYRNGSVYEIHHGQVEELTTKQGLLAGTDICALTTDREGRIWFAKGGRAGVFENGKLRALYDLGPHPMRLAAASDGRVWLCAGFHLFKCDITGKLEDFGQFDPENSGTVVTVMLEDHKGAVWIGTSFSGLFRRDQAGFSLIPTTHQGILSLLEDHEGNIWAGTFGGGLNRIRRRTITLEGAGAGLPFTSVQSVCEDTNGTIWAVTQNGVLVQRNQGSGEWTAVPVSDDWPGQATCVTVDQAGTLWIGTRTHSIDDPVRGLYSRREGRIMPWDGTGRLQIGTLHTLLAGQSGDLWMGQELPAAVLRLHDGKLETYPAPPDSRIIRAMVQDADGNVWAGTSKGILLRVAGDHLVDATPRSAQELAPIRCLYTTPDGALWIGYAGWGLGCLWNGHYTEINSGDGLYDDYISHIVADGQGWLWFGANRGLFKVRHGGL
jgi:ligand-binding sensor domain-containing protein